MGQYGVLFYRHRPVPVPVIPGVAVTTDMRILCDGHTFEITSVEDVKGRGMYLEIMAQEVKPGG